MIPRAHILALAGCLAALVSLRAADERRVLRIGGGSDGAVSLESVGPLDSGLVLKLERSGDLREWDEAARVHGRLLPYADQPPPGSGSRSRWFYRLRSKPGTSEDDWTNQLDLGGDGEAFLANPEGGSLAEAPFVKFSILLDDPGRVYFQDSRRYPFHFPFAVARLPGLGGLSITEFDAIALRSEGQRLVVGSVILAPDGSLTEAGIQFAGQEPFAVGDVARWFATVRSRIGAPAGWRFFYLPSFEQSSPAIENETFFREHGIEIASAERWVSEHACYSTGWALGKLVFVPAAEIAAAYGDGRLSHADILVTDAVPAEIPVVAGVVSLQPATPNSHVALLAQSFRIPFAFASGEAMRDQLAAWNGREVLCIVEEAESDGACRIRLTDVEGRLTPDEREAILALKKPAPPDIAPKESAGTLSLPVDELTPNDTRFVGGKAAHFGFLRRAIPDHAPEAIALTFDLWDGFMDQHLPATGAPLREWIASRLARHPAFPPDIAGLRTDLAEIRAMITVTADFDEAQRAAILAALSPFDPSRKIRFRSSTNAEDGEQFSGAGLYDSFSGCVLDDTDGDSSGPSHCDPDERNERGVFRALRKVYASFYNENAFLERLRHRIPEADVGMAVLVHHSFPDETEMANGVGTLEIGKPGDGARAVTARLVTQLGAVSVANPAPGTLPEVVTATYAGATGEASLAVKDGSTLVPDGGHVMAWEADYRSLLDLLDAAARSYEEWFPDRHDLLLDFEYKKIQPGVLVVKQIRPVPRPQPVPPPEIE